MLGLWYQSVCVGSPAAVARAAGCAAARTTYLRAVARRQQLAAPALQLPLLHLGGGARALDISEARRFGLSLSRAWFMHGCVSVRPL